jgi:ribonucleoside-diphosphate reductase alpha chain
MPLDEVARTVLERRYLRQDAEGNVVEDPPELFHRVATNLAQAEARWGGDPDEWAPRFERLMADRDFLPNSPTLMNAGTEIQQLAACFVLPVEDSLPSIFGTLEDAALIHQSGGGTGFSFSNLRPKGAPVRSTGGVASGPVSFMKVYDAATEQIKQGGRRRGANMAVLSVHHPDIRDFVTAKRDEGVLRNFNLSVGTTARFWEAYDAGEPYDLEDPRTGEPVGTADPRSVMDTIAETAHATGDPGLLFLDRVNEDNPTPHLGRIEATNPCGEQPLLPYEACTLGSVNLAHHTSGGAVDEHELRGTVRLAVRLLDDAITMSDYPVDAIRRAVDRTRKIGLGVMGFHDALVDLGIPYDSDEAVEAARDITGIIQDAAWETSRELARQREPFPAWEDSTLEEPARNAVTTTVAPTGTISMIAGCSAGIEPLYGVAYTKQVMGGLPIVNDRFVDLAEERGFRSEELMDRLRDRTTIQDVDAIPDDVKALFQTAHDVPARRHLEVQAAFQEGVDNAVSKTVNLPPEATPADVRRIYERARELDLKGITVFVSGSRDEQVLGCDPLEEEPHGKPDAADSPTHDEPAPA